MSHETNTINDVSYSTVAANNAVSFSITLEGAVLTRFVLPSTAGAGPAWYERIFLRAPFSLVGHTYTILFLLASQGHHVVRRVVFLVRVAAPLVVYFAIRFFVTWLICYQLCIGYTISATQSFEAASKKFELTIAVTVATYGP